MKKAISVSILVLTMTVGMFSCQKNKNSKQNVANSSVQTFDILETSDSAQSCSPRILERNTENGLMLLTDKQLKEIKDKAKKLDKNLPIIGILMYDDVLHRGDCSYRCFFQAHQRREKTF